MLNPLLSSGGVLIIQSGAVESGATVASGGILFVSSGATVNKVTLLAGGSEVIEAGGTASGNSDSGTVIVSSGGLEVGGTVLNGGQEAVQSGGAASATTISAGGTDTIASGCLTLQNPMLSSGGMLNILSGGAGKRRDGHRRRDIGRASGVTVSAMTVRPAVQCWF